MNFDSERYVPKLAAAFVRGRRAQDVYDLITDSESPGGRCSGVSVAPGCATVAQTTADRTVGGLRPLQLAIGPKSPCPSREEASRRRVPAKAPGFASGGLLR
jgi:hypothetical protein